jgi:hypothetical protein
MIAAAVAKQLAFSYALNNHMVHVVQAGDMCSSRAWSIVPSIQASHRDTETSGAAGHMGAGSVRQQAGVLQSEISLTADIQVFGFSLFSSRAHSLSLVQRC